MHDITSCPGNCRTKPFISTKCNPGDIERKSVLSDEPIFLTTIAIHIRIFHTTPNVSLMWEDK